MAHNWLLTFDENVPLQLARLPPRDRMAVFRSIAHLLQAENPASVQGVKKLVEKRFEGLWRQRQGNYRIFFELHPGTTVHLSHTYTGRLHLVVIHHRSRAY